MEAVCALEEDGADGRVSHVNGRKGGREKGGCCCAMPCWAKRRSPKWFSISFSFLEFIQELFEMISNWIQKNSRESTTISSTNKQNNTTSHMQVYFIKIYSRQ
jgi:hypothetical protein